MPIPESDETLSNWVRELAELYGLSPSKFLKAIGNKSIPRDLRTLDIYPQPRHLFHLAQFTGISATFLREEMTFSNRSQSVQRRIRFHRPLCPTCIEEAAHATRRIELRRWFAPWLFVCDRHPRAPTRDEVDNSIGISTILHDVACLSARLERFRSLSKPAVSPILSDAGDWIDFVREINSLIVFRVRRDQGGIPVFEVIDERINSPYEPWEHPSGRNTLGVSAWYASYAAKDPAGFLYINTRNRDKCQAHRLLKFLANFLTPAVLYVPWRRACGISRGQSGIPPDFDNNFFRQADLLHTADYFFRQASLLEDYTLSPYSIRRPPNLDLGVFDKYDSAINF